MKFKINVCFAVKAPTGLSWPGIALDYGKRQEYYKNLLNNNYGDEYEFTYSELTAQASDEDLKKLTNEDGFIMILLAHGTALAQRISPMLKHGLIIDDPYGGSGDIIRVNNLIGQNNYPVGTVGTMDEEKLLHRISVYLAVPKIKNSKILVFKNFEKMNEEKEAELNRSIGTGSTMKRYRAGKPGFMEGVEKIKETFGIDVEVMTLATLNKYREEADVEEAKKMAQKWASQAKEVVEPTMDDLVESGKMYLALKRAKKEVGADVISVDCILMFFAYDMGVYPCMGFFEMNNNGEIGVCEGDLDACISELIIHTISNKPGLVSDPFVDTERNEIVYSHCVASCKPFGKDGESAPYRIRTHSEDHFSAAIQAILPENYPLTTIKVSSQGKAMSIHSGISAGNVDHESGCRTKLVCKVPNSKLIMDNWHNELFSWHRVTVYGDYRRDFIEVGKYLGLKIYEEDKENCA